LFDKPKVQSNKEVIIPTKIKNINKANPISNAYSIKFPPLSSKKNRLRKFFKFLSSLFKTKCQTILDFFNTNYEFRYLNNPFF